MASEDSSGRTCARGRRGGKAERGRHRRLRRVPSGVAGGERRGGERRHGRNCSRVVVERGRVKRRGPAVCRQGVGGDRLDQRLGAGHRPPKQFIAEGAQVCLLARGQERLAQLEAVGLGPGIGDRCGRPRQRGRRLRAHRVRTGPSLDILIDNAALSGRRRSRSCPTMEILIQVNTNRLGPIYTCRQPSRSAHRPAGATSRQHLERVERSIRSRCSGSTWPPEAAVEALGTVFAGGIRENGVEIRVTTLIRGSRPGRRRLDRLGVGPRPRRGGIRTLDQRRPAQQDHRQEHGAQDVDLVADVHV